MIIFDIQLGRFSLIAQKETFKNIFKVTREGPGEVILDLPLCSLIFTNHRKAEQVA